MTLSEFRIRKHTTDLLNLAWFGFEVRDRSDFKFTTLGAYSGGTHANGKRLSPLLIHTDDQVTLLDLVARKTELLRWVQLP